MSKVPVLSRRTVLRATGVSLALPWLEAMHHKAEAVEPRSTTPRLAVFYFPMGCYQREWNTTPAADGKANIPGFLNDNLKGLRDDLVWFNNVKNQTAGKGDHETAAGTFLNSAAMQLSPSVAFRRSFDQLIADALAKGANPPAIPSLTLSAPGFKEASSCCRDVEAGLNYISWQGGATPTTKLQDPRDLFERMFSKGTTVDDRKKAEEARLRKLSALDLAKTQAARLRSNLGKTDRQRLEQHFESIRAVETRLQSSQDNSCQVPAKPQPGLSFETQNQLMFDLSALAFECDLTPIVTFIMDYEFSDRLIASPGIDSGHHSVSHHGEDANKIRQYRLIQNFYAKRYAAFVERLKNTKASAQKSVLDESAVILASGMNNGDNHLRDALPFILAGKANGKIVAGRVLNADRSVGQIFRSIMRLYGLPDKTIADFGEGAGEFSALLV